MSQIGYGYGSEWHLLRYLGYHRHDLGEAIRSATDGDVVDWLDFPFNPSNYFCDDEWKGLDFLGKDHHLIAEWGEWWPQSGNPPNWDAIGRIRFGDREEWLLVEAKANLNEIKSRCGAKDNGGLPLIRKALDETKNAVGAPPAADWLKPYYQLANRLATLHFLNSRGEPARLLYVYFLGDTNPRANCPRTKADWDGELTNVNAHLDLRGASKLEQRVHKIFLPVCPR